MMRLRYGLAILLLAALSACASIATPGPEAQAAADQLASNISSSRSLRGAGPDKARPDVALFARVFDRVRVDYVRQVDQEMLLAAATGALQDVTPPKGETTDDWLVETAIKGMLQSLDPYSAYLPRDAYGAVKDSMRGQFGGLGIQISTPKEGGGVEVVTPLDDTPAAKAGIRAGDRITHVEKQSILDMSLGDVVRLLRGPVGSSVELTVRRGADQVLEFNITRAMIRVEAVKWRLEDDFGYLRITGFTDKTAEEVDAAVREIRKHLGGRMAGLIIDLRNNPGGLLIESVAVSDAFIDDGDIVTTRGRNSTQRYAARYGDIVAGLPIVALVNGGSASAAEILAGALQDHGRATLIGSKTFGKGTVQTVIPMGQGTALKLTTAHYYTPSGNSVEGGIAPDVVIEASQDSDEDPVLERAIAELQRLAGF